MTAKEIMLSALKKASGKNRNAVLLRINELNS